MPVAFLLGLLSLVAYLWVSHSRSSISRFDVLQAMRGCAAVFSLLATLSLAMSGRWGPATVTFSVTLVFVRSFFGHRRAPSSFGSEGRTTHTETKYFKMRLDHESGEIDGLVKTGSFKDVLLSVLALDQLLELRLEIQAVDHDSLALLDAFLDHHQPQWREQETSANDPEDLPMGEARALDILGLKSDASIEDIKRAHRHLMGKVHPDRGGSGHLAAQVNAAKELLLQIRR